jgi:hypothetical protein
MEINMLETSNGEPTGQWGWLGWIVGGIVAIVQALVHRRSRARSLNGHTQDYLDRVSRLENQHRAMDGQIIALRSELDDFRHENKVWLESLRDMIRNRT